METVRYAQGRWSAPLPVGLDSPHTLVLAFAAPGLAQAPQPLQDLHRAFGTSVLLGCSTAGEIAGDQVHDDSISVAVVRFEHTRLVQADTPVAHAGDSGLAGQRLAEQLRADDLQAVFVLSDGLAVNGTPLVAALAEGLGGQVPITGGLAGDGSRFGSTWVLCNGAPTPQRISAVGLYGQRLRVSHGCNGGWLDFGPERRITRSRGNVLYELDGKPALALYKNYLGDRATGLPGTALLFPLSVRGGDGDTETLVRTVLAVDEAEQSMTFAGDIPHGGVARLMRASTEALIGSAGLAGLQAGRGAAAEGPTLAVAVSCVGRRLVLGERTEEEVEAVAEAMPEGTRQVGFYSYGEIAPAASGGFSGLHNQTMTVTVLAEA